MKLKMPVRTKKTTLESSFKMLSRTLIRLEQGRSFNVAGNQKKCNAMQVSAHSLTDFNVFCMKTEEQTPDSVESLRRQREAFRVYDTALSLINYDTVFLYICLWMLCVQWQNLRPLLSASAINSRTYIFNYIFFPH